LEEIEALVIKMHKADDEYGCGFYNDEKWLEAYRELRAAVGMEPQE